MTRANRDPVGQIGGAPDQLRDEWRGETLPGLDQIGKRSISQEWSHFLTENRCPLFLKML